MFGLPVPVLVVICLIWGFIGALMGANKAMGGTAGFFLGVLLGPLGLIIIAVSSAATTPTLRQVQAVPASGAGWHPDPLGRTESRFYDGKQWTQHVGRVEPNGDRHQFEDPI